MQAEDIDLWHGRLDGLTAPDEPAEALLDERERRQAEAIRRPLLRRRYRETRVRLRLKLGDYLGTDPAALRFERTEYGKPYLPDYPEIGFNLSHTGDRLLLAVTRKGRIGVDGETVRPRNGLEGIAEKCFAENELKEWRKLPDAHRTFAFYRLWTAKEAFVKAAGRGIALGLNRVVVAADEPPRLLEIPEQYGQASHWQLFCLTLEDGLCAAVCVEGDQRSRLLVRNWEG